MSIKQPTPDEMLRMCRYGIAKQDASILAIAFTTLDKYLREGGNLPTSWERRGPQAKGVFCSVHKDWHPAPVCETSPVDAAGIVYDMRPLGEVDGP